MTYTYVQSEGHTLVLSNTRVLQIQDLRANQEKESCIGLTQENSIESSIQDCLPYIQIPNSSCELSLAYPKQPYIYLKVNICITYYMISSL